MTEKNIISAKAYYEAINNRNLAEAEKYLDSNVEYMGPLTNMSGKKAVVNGIKYFMTVFEKLNIRTVIGSKDQVILIYDLDCPAPIGNVRTAVLMDFKNHLISKVELFFDPRPFERKI